MTQRSSLAVLALTALLLTGCPTSEKHLPIDAPPPDLRSDVIKSESKDPEFVRLAVPLSWEGSDGEVLPITYLEQLSVDTSRALSRAERQQLAVLIRQAHEDSVRLYGQSYYLSAASQIGQLIRSNFPDAPAREGGALFYLGELATYLETRVASER